MGQNRGLGSPGTSQHKKINTFIKTFSVLSEVVFTIDANGTTKNQFLGSHHGITNKILSYFALFTQCLYDKL